VHYLCSVVCEGMDNGTVMAVQSLLDSQNVHETSQTMTGYFRAVVYMFLTQSEFNSMEH